MKHIVMSGRWNLIKYPLAFRASLSDVPREKQGKIERKFVVIPIESPALPIKDTKAGRLHLPNNSFGYEIDTTTSDFKFTAEQDTSNNCLLFAGWVVRQTEAVIVATETTNAEILKEFEVNSWNDRSSSVEVFALLKPGERLVLKLSVLDEGINSDVYRIYFYDGNNVEKIRSHTTELDKILELLDRKFQMSNS